MCDVSTYAIHYALLICIDVIVVFFSFLHFWYVQVCSLIFFFLFNLLKAEPIFSAYAHPIPSALFCCCHYNYSVLPTHCLGCFCVIKLLNF